MAEQFAAALLAQLVAAHVPVDPELLAFEPISTGKHNSSYFVHGAGNGLLLPFVMRFNLPERKAKFAKIAALLGAEATSDIGTMAERAIASVRKALRTPHSGGQ